VLRPPKWTASGRLKIDRANQHIYDFERAVDAFKELSPYFIHPEVNPQGRHGVQFSVRVVHDMPTAVLSTIAADAIHNLLTALEHLWKNATKVPPTARKNYFPAFQSTEGLKARLEREQQSAAKVACQLLYDLDALCPDNPFRKIREFDDSDKHHALSLVASTLESLRVDIGQMLGMERLNAYPFFTELARHKPKVIIEGTPLFSVAGDVAELYPDRELAFDIAFGDSEILKGEPVLPTLKYFAKSVDGLATEFINAGLLD
jgi:hypothetical protein